MNYADLVRKYDLLKKQVIKSDSISLDDDQPLEPSVSYTSNKDFLELLAEYNKIIKLKKMMSKYFKQKVTISSTKKKKIIKIEKELKEKETHQVTEPQEIIEKEEIKKPTMDFVEKVKINIEKESQKASINYEPFVSPPVAFSLSAKEEAKKTIEDLFNPSRSNINETEVKKRMFELTKMLFKVKDQKQKESIKAEIASLKNLLVNKGSSDKLKISINSLISRQNFEFKNAKQYLEESIETSLKNLFDATRRALNKTNSQYYDDLRDEYRSKLSQLRSLFLSITKKYASYLIEKHLEELNLIKDKISINLKPNIDAQKKIIMNYENSLSEMLSLLNERGDEYEKQLFNS